MSGRHSCTWEAEMPGVPAHLDLCVDRIETEHFLCQADTAVPCAKSTADNDQNSLCGTPHAKSTVNNDQN